MTEQTNIDVNTATRNELLKFAHTLGLDAPNTMSKADVKDLIAKQLGQQVKAEGPASEEPSPLVEKNMAALRKQKKVRIMIHENPDHPRRIPVSVNGVNYSIKPGVWVDVPESVVEVLRNAKATYITQYDNERGIPVNVSREGLQFPFQIAAPGQV